MDAQIVKWGNSQGIIIPKKVLQDSGIHLNEKVNLSSQDGRITIEKVFRHKTLEERATEFGGTLGPVEEYDWGEPEWREVW